MQYHCCCLNKITNWILNQNFSLNIFRLREFIALLWINCFAHCLQSVFNVCPPPILIPKKFCSLSLTKIWLKLMLIVFNHVCVRNWIVPKLKFQYMFYSFGKQYILMSSISFDSADILHSCSILFIFVKNLTVEQN